jgi:hypothetical protein
MRYSAVLVIASTMLWLDGCGGRSLSTGAGGVDGSRATGVVGAGGSFAVGGVVGTGGALATGGIIGTGGSLSPGTGGAGATLATGGAVGTGGGAAIGTGGADAALAAGGAVGGDGGVSSEVAAGTGGAVSSGGVVGTGGALASGGAVGAGDARATDSVVDSAAEAAVDERGGRNIRDLIPLDNTVAGWTVDRQHSRNGNGQPMIATTQQEAEALIDGAAAGFFVAPYTPNVFAYQVYVNSTLPAAPDGANLTLYILQMPSAEQATGLYRAVLTLSEYSMRAGTPEDWQPTTPALGTESRIEDTATEWWINFHKDVFYVEVKLSPSYGPPPDYIPGSIDTKQEALRFAQAVASRI